MRAFTFVEVIIALSVASISLLGLIRLHLINIKMNRSVEITSQAALLAQEKIAETFAAGFPDKATNRGIIQKNTLMFNWETKVTNPTLPQLNKDNISGLRKISVDVSWEQTGGQKHLRMSTYIADRELK